jgi:hypothetical protein
MRLEIDETATITREARTANMCIAASVAGRCNHRL